jgi:hypothetical protein
MLDGVMATVSVTAKAKLKNATIFTSRRKCRADAVIVKYLLHLKMLGLEIL